LDGKDYSNGSSVWLVRGQADTPVQQIALGVDESDNLRIASAIAESINWGQYRALRDQVELITSAAIRRDSDNTLFTGSRHPDCIREVIRLTNAKRVGAGFTQGFLTNRNRFVDRVEGLALARANGQLLPGHEGDTELFSESLW